ncbi:MAG: hypothetical protein M9897_07220 [Brumimicrobium sp.]|nr:hypothetical protein [Brumimicrobium sp.]
MSKSTNTNRYESDISTIHINEEGIFIVRLKNTNLPYDVKEISAQLVFILQHRTDDFHKVILDTRGSLALPTDETIDHFQKHNKLENKYALVIDNLPMELMLRFTLHKNSFSNTKIFRSFDSAKDWIMKD